MSDKKRAFYEHSTNLNMKDKAGKNSKTIESILSVLECEDCTVEEAIGLLIGSLHAVLLSAPDELQKLRCAIGDYVFSVEDNKEQAALLRGISKAQLELERSVKEKGVQ